LFDHGGDILIPTIEIEASADVRLRHRPAVKPLDHDLRRHLSCLRRIAQRQNDNRGHQAKQNRAFLSHN